MIKVDIISGFLGSGKTTLIKNLLESINDERVVVIENEFGQIGIDKEIIQKDGFDIIELQNGCICCSIKLNFKDTLLEVINNFNPTRIIIEPTGVGLLSEIITMINDSKLNEVLSLNSLITVVDGVNYFEYIDNFGDFFEDQIENAQIIIISKSQFIDKNNLDNIIKSLKNINKNAHIIHENWSNISFLKLFEVLNLLSDEISENLDCKNRKDITENMKSIESMSINPLKSYSIEGIEDILKNLSENTFGNIIRCKGFVDSGDYLLEFNYVNKQYTIKQRVKNTNPKLTIIGTNLKKKDLLKTFE
ncbi:CobW family GTP-binding protein [Paeniclostridium hominis]|uniref:CobW family GTP-binding protein n=1 Tax=Paeniclostridium hominis TaxID=2764329 RepID=UPI0022E2D338|nr:CobW family GTP-binding protein [Paeniclostridium hominis]